MKFIIGQKLAMTQVFKDDGTVVPVTRVKAGPCVVTQIKTQKRDNVEAVQIGYGEQKSFRLNKPMRGHLGANPAVRYLRDFTVTEDQGLVQGDLFTVKIFEKGDKVQVVGNSKGKGFQGVVKRHGFKGSPASHGHKDQLRMPGSIGATDAARVFKGTRMAGQMGDQRVTVINLEIIDIDVENDELLIKGAMPGARNGLLLISTKEGKIEPENKVEKKKKAEVKEEKKEDVVEEKVEEKKEKTTDKKEEIKVEEKQKESAEETTAEEKK
jgi:large subunit ribosomal protein L3